MSSRFRSFYVEFVLPEDHMNVSVYCPSYGFELLHVKCTTPTDICVFIKFEHQKSFRQVHEMFTESICVKDMPFEEYDAFKLRPCVSEKITNPSEDEMHDTIPSLYSIQDYICDVKSFERIDKRRKRMAYSQQVLSKRMALFTDTHLVNPQ